MGIRITLACMSHLHGCWFWQVRAGRRRYKTPGGDIVFWWAGVLRKMPAA